MQKNRIDCKPMFFIAFKMFTKKKKDIRFIRLCAQSMSLFVFHEYINDSSHLFLSGLILFVVDDAILLWIFYFFRVGFLLLYVEKK